MGTQKGLRYIAPPNHLISLELLPHTPDTNNTYPEDDTWYAEDPSSYGSFHSLHVCSVSPRCFFGCRPRTRKKGRAPEPARARAPTPIAAAAARRPASRRSQAVAATAAVGAAAAAAVPSSAAFRPVMVPIVSAAPKAAAVAAIDPAAAAVVMLSSLPRLPTPVRALPRYTVEPRRRLLSWRCFCCSWVCVDRPQGRYSFANRC